MIDRTMISLDWDARTLRIVTGTTGRKAMRIDQVLSVPIPADVRTDNAGSMGAFIRSALQKAAVRARNAALQVPREQVNFCTLRLPASSQSDMASMVAFQIPKELPYPADQAVVDFADRPSGDKGDTSEVLVAAVLKSRLQFFLDVCGAAGLKPQHIGLRPNANEIAVNALLRATPQERVLFVDVGPTTTEIDVLHNGRLVFSRAASVTVPEGTMRVGEGGVPEAAGPRLAAGTEGAEEGLREVVRELMIEVTRSVEAYRATDPGMTLQHAVIGGATEIEEALGEAIQRQYSITAQPFNPAGVFGWDADRGAAAGAFASALGLLLSDQESASRRFDFLHPKKAETTAQKRIKKAPVALTTVAAATAAAVVFYFQSVKPQYDLRESLRGEVKNLRRNVDELEEFTAMVDEVTAYERDRIVWIDELHDLTGVLADNRRIVLKSIDMSQKDRDVKMPFAALENNEGPAMVARLEGFRPEGGGSPRYRATLGATSYKPGERYGNQGSIQIQVGETGAGR